MATAAERAQALFAELTAKPLGEGSPMAHQLKHALAEVLAELSESRAEIERLKAACDAHVEINKETLAQRDAAEAEIERLKRPSGDDFTRLTMNALAERAVKLRASQAVMLAIEDARYELLAAKLKERDRG